MRKDLLLQILRPVIGLAVVIALIFVGYSYEWTGFGEHTPTMVGGVEIQRGKTLWDWLQLLIVPAALGFGAIWFNQTQQEHDKKREENRLEEEIVQQYLDKMTDLMLKEGLRTSEQDA